MRARVGIWLWLAACGDAGSAGPDADLDDDAPAPSDAQGADAELEDEADASIGDAGAAHDAGGFLTGPAFEDAGGPDACNHLLNDAPQIETVYIAAPLPEAGGGMIEEGVYERVAVRHFTGAGGDAGTADASSDRAVLWLTEGEFHFSQSNAGGPDEHLSGTYAQQGTRLTLTRTCPQPALVSPFDQAEASERELVFYSSSLQRAIAYRRR